MEKLPCFMCGKDVEAEGGHNTFYYNGERYARHGDRFNCDGRGSYFNDNEFIARLEEMSEDDKRKSQLREE